jgi:hypothetical protein
VYGHRVKKFIHVATDCSSRFMHVATGYLIQSKTRLGSVLQAVAWRRYDFTISFLSYAYTA